MSLISQKVALSAKILSDFNAIEASTGVPIDDRIKRLALKKVWVRPDTRSCEEVNKSLLLEHRSCYPLQSKLVGRLPFPQ